MTKEQKEFRDVMESILGRYTQNKLDLYRISDYIFRVAVDVLNGSDISAIKSTIPEVTEVEKTDFYRALRETSVFTSQKLLFKILGDTQKRLKEVIPMVEVSQSSQTGLTGGYLYPTPQSNEAEFDIDISSIPKVDTKALKSAVDKDMRIERERQKSLSSDFEMENMDFSAMNQGKPKSVKYAEDTYDGEPDVSMMTEGSYDSVPSIERDLDY